jgi:exodeoxyribonuclease VII large subunit
MQQNIDASLAAARRGPESRDVYTVTRLNREAKAVLEGSFPALWVQGELSNLARPGSGHWYFSLKDAHCQVRCAMFRNRNRMLRFAPENGMQIMVRATVSLYEGRGDFQLIVDQMEPAGEGDLQRAFEELKRKLHGEGLFDEARKKALPAFPRTIGVITSPTGAAIRDILNVLGRRWPAVAVLIYPVPVQGSGAAERIIAALDRAGSAADCDLLILARGGGSLEDLQPFNEEGVARTIARCPLPVVTGIGHEIDFTIADFVADRRAPTPSAAAELASPDQAQILRLLAVSGGRLRSRMERTLHQHLNLLRQLEKRLPRPARVLQNLMQRLDDTSLRLLAAVRAGIGSRRTELFAKAAVLNRHHPRLVVRLQQQRCTWLADRLVRGAGQQLLLLGNRLEAAARAMRAVGPTATLERGYAIVTDGNGRIVTSAESLQNGDVISARFRHGRAEAQVTKVTAGKDESAA